MNTNETCNYRSIYTDSGDRGADMAEHNRVAHPDHTHVWGPSTYDWEQPGKFHMVSDPDNFPRAMRVERTVAPTRCTVCSVEPKNVQSCG